MHVLAIADYLNNVGGAELSTRTIVAGLARDEAIEEVTVVGVDVDGQPRLDFGDASVIPVTVSPRVRGGPDYVADLVVERQLARAVRERLPETDVVHAHHRRSALALARLDTEPPKVATIRDYWPICPISTYHVDGEQCSGCDDRLGDCVSYQGWTGMKGLAARPYLLGKRRHQRPAVTRMDRLVFIADHLRGTVTADLESTPASSVIYNPVEVDTVAGSAERPNGPKFVTASTLTQDKGVDTVIRAFESVKKDLPTARLHVFGDGPLREELESLAVDFGVSSSITFHGRAEPATVYDKIRSATATVFPSRWNEPFGRITVESMMLGTVVVGSDVGGIAEVIEDGETGLLFPPGDDAALASQLLRLADDDALRGRISAAARSIADQFTPAAVTDQHVALYRDLVG